MVSGAAAAGVSSVAAGVDSMGVSILGASSETLAALPFSGDFERPRDLKPEVNRRVRVSFLGVGGLYSASSAGASAISVEAGSTTTGAGVDSEASPFVMGVLSFLGSKPAKMLARLLGFSVLVSGAGVSSVVAGVSSTGAGVVVSTTVSVTTASSVVSMAAGSGEASFLSALPLNRFWAKPLNDLRFSFLSISARQHGF